MSGGARESLTWRKEGDQVLVPGHRLPGQGPRVENWRSSPLIDLRQLITLFIVGGFSGRTRAQRVTGGRAATHTCVRW